MRIKFFAFLILFIFICTSCFEKKHKFTINFIENADYELDLEYYYLSSVYNMIKANNRDTSIHIYFQNFETKNIQIYALEKDTIIDLSYITYNIPSNYYGIFFTSIDSYYSFSNNSQELKFKNLSAEKTKIININQEYTPVITPETRLVVNDNYCLLGNSSKDIGFGNQQERIKYYKYVKPILVINLKDSTQRFRAICDFPETYSQGGINFYDPFPSYCFGKNKDICVSFGADDFISLYKDSTLLLRKAVKSLYIDEFKPYPDSKQFDMLFLKNYVSEEPKYLKVIYDPWENLYYRIVKHRHDPKNGNNVELTWSVIVFDTDLNVLGEKKYSYCYKPNLFIPTPFGVLIAKESTKNSGKTTLSLQKIIINEK